MLSSEAGRNFVIAGFAMAIFFVIALFAIIVYWIRRIRKRKNNRNKKDHDEMNVEVNCHKESMKESNDNEISPYKEVTESYENFMATALSSGINLIVYSCMPKSKSFKLLLAESKHSGSESRIGVFNQGKQIKKDTLFGPFQSEKECFIIQRKKKYLKGIRKLKEANNWLGFINRARRHEDMNMIVIKRTDNETYFFEASRDINTGEEMLAICSWIENDKNLLL